MGGAASTEAKEEADIVVCQADKRIVCAPPTANSSGNRGSGMGARDCKQDKTVVPIAVCNFDVDLWNLGGTCISNHLQGLQFPDCPVATKGDYKIAKQCRMATDP